MNRIAAYHRPSIAAAAIFSAIFLLSQCVNKKSDATQTITNLKGKQFADSQACANCHKNITAGHLHSAHALTSGIASAGNIKGSFEPNDNKFVFNDSVVVAMEKRGDEFFQSEYIDNSAKRIRRFDVVIGSGVMGQSYLSWRENNLFQLPITYFTAAKKWSNSPGFPDKAVFNRPITSRCLECHASYAAVISAPGVEPEEFDHQKMIYGVTCEKCHGPGLQHVQFQSENPTVSVAKYIVNPAKLTRQQNLDLCALCHGGRLQKTQPSFSFSAGDTLSNFFHVDTTMPDPNKVDVHGNQYALLRASKCFRMSATLTCNTCHDTHKNERGQAELFSQRCMTCHNTEHNNFCKMNKVFGEVIKTNCIDCHMPVKPSKAIAVFLPGDTLATAAKIRSHFITVYPEESKRLIEEIKKGRN